MLSELPFEKVRKICESSGMLCKTSEELSLLEGIIGQERAVKALKFGLEIKQSGFNIYAAGLPGTGKKTVVTDFLEEIAEGKPVPSDLCYVNNFRNSYEPRGLRLPSGRGKELQSDMKKLIEETRNLLPKAFESEDYALKKDAKLKEIEEERKGLLTSLNERAQKEGFVLRSTPIGVLIIPVVKNQPLSDQDLLGLPREMRDAIEGKRERLRIELRSAMRQLRELQRKIDDELQKLNREIANYTFGHLIEGLPAKTARATRLPRNALTQSRMAIRMFSSRLGTRSSASMLRETSNTNTTSRPLFERTSRRGRQPGRAIAMTRNVSAMAVAMMCSRRAVRAARTGGDAGGRLSENIESEAARLPAA